MSSSSLLIAPALLSALLVFASGTVSGASAPAGAARPDECLFPAQDLRLTFGTTGSLTATR
ncbi:MAG TPA: hypothetical protein VGP91_04635, partial [Actinoplanes sp.]|nr:hypothetical protein [Actinoplanes sp.]